MSIKKYGTGGKPEVHDDNDVELPEVEKETKDDDDDRDTSKGVASER